MTLPHALILAAGASRRFGSPKALANFNGYRLIDLTVNRAKEIVGEHFTVVLGAHADAISTATGLPEQQVARHTTWTLGMAESLKFGISALPQHSIAAMVMLVDQPLIDAAALRQLVAAWQKNPQQPAAAEYSGDIGAPCILPREIFPAVMNLSGDKGAKALLRSLPLVSRIAMPSAEFDIDTPDDLQQASLRTKNHRGT